MTRLSMEPENRGAFDRFLVPESEASLKIVFDNVRNYVICAALFGIAFYPAKPTAENLPPAFQNSILTYLLHAGPMMIIIASCALLVFNTFQSYAIAVALAKSFLNWLVPARRMGELEAVGWFAVFWVLFVTAAFGFLSVVMLICNWVLKIGTAHLGL